MTDTAAVKTALEQLVEVLMAEAKEWPAGGSFETRFNGFAQMAETALALLDAPVCLHGHTDYVVGCASCVLLHKRTGDAPGPPEPLCRCPPGTCLLHPSLTTYCLRGMREDAPDPLEARLRALVERLEQTVEEVKALPFVTVRHRSGAEERIAHNLRAALALLDAPDTVRCRCGHVEARHMPDTHICIDCRCEAFTAVTPAPDLSVRIAEIQAHRACHAAEHDPLHGKIHGYCVVCGIPFPCAYVGKPLASLEARLRALVEESIDSECGPDVQYCWFCEADINGKNGPVEPHRQNCYYIRAKAALLPREQEPTP